MDQTEEPVQSNRSENDENFDSEEQEEQYCGSKSAHVIEDCRESELNDCDSKQVRFAENGEIEEKDSEEQRLRTDKNVCEANGVDDLTHDDDDDENDDDDDQKETPSASAGDDEVFEQEEEGNIAAESDEEKLYDKQNLSTDENKTEEDATPEEDDIEKYIQNAQKESQYDRTSSFSSLSVNVGSTQQDSDSEVQIPSRASPDSGDDTPMVDGENYGCKQEDIEANEDESDNETETQEEREARLVKQAHLDIASSVDSPEDLDANDNKSASNEDLYKQESDSEDTLTASESGLESTKEKDDVEEESLEKAHSHDEGVGNNDENDENDEDIDENVYQEKSEEVQIAAAEKEVPEVLVSENKDCGQAENVDESEKAEPVEPAPARKDDEKEETKVKELGRLFQGKDQNPKVVCPKGTTSSEKSPISVRRFREMFEHGEPLLSPAAYANVPEEECSSPRPGIVKNLRDLFENPKNFEWKEAPKSTAVVN